MSDLISGLNIQNIFEYNSASSYEKYDVVDYEFNSGFSVYPTYTGLGSSGLSFWFSNDRVDNFLINSDDKITGWINNIKIDNNLFCDKDVSPPVIDFNENYTTLIGSQTFSGSGFDYSNRTIFLVADPIAYIQNKKQNLIGFGTGDSTRYLSVSGENENNFAKIWLDNSGFNAISQIYGSPNIFTIVQDDSNIRIRHNGVDIGTYFSYDNYWKSGEMFLNKNESIADSNNFKGINYYEIFHFTGVLSNSGISGYEKYLFEKYFDLDGLYFAKENVPAGDSYSPITFTGKNYWTQKIDDLFTLSYGSSANFSAKLSRLDFGDGYKTNVVSTLNSLESKFSLAYDGLTDKQSKALIAFFENTPEAKNKSLYEGFEGVRMNIFTPYKNDAELYFLNINHDSSYKDLNKITIEATSLYESILDYKGMFVVLNENAIKTYTNELSTFEYNDVFYYNSDDLNYKGYYFYTGENISLQTTGPSGPFAPEFSPTGENSYFTKEFYFKPDIDYNINENIRLRTTEYKNSTKQFSKDGINPNMLEFDLKFSKRSTKEARAILKFLDDKAGYKIFNYTLPQPYNKQIEVYSPEWSHSYDYFDNHTINVKFIQTKSLNKAVCTFNTNINFFSPSYFDADYIKYYNNVNVLNPNIVPNTEDSSYTNRSNYKWVMLVFPDIEKGTTTKLTSLTITDYDNAENDFCKKYAVYLPAGSTVPTTSVAIYDTKSEYWIYTNPNPSKYHEAIKIYAGTGFQHPDEITLFSSYATDIYTNKLDTSEGGEKIETTELRESSNSSSSTTLFQIYTAINNSGNLGGDGSFENPYIIDIL